MKLRTSMLLIGGLVLPQCQTTEPPLTLPPQEMPAKPLAAGEIKKVFMTTADHEYLTALLTSLMECDTDIEFYAESAADSPATPQTNTFYPPRPIGRVSPLHFRVLAACPNKIYTGELNNAFTKYKFIAKDEDSAYNLTLSMSNNAEHGIRVGGIAVSSPTFHHFIQTLIQKSEAEAAEVQP